MLILPIISWKPQRVIINSFPLPEVPYFILRKVSNHQSDPRLTCALLPLTSISTMHQKTAECIRWQPIMWSFKRCVVRGNIVRSCRCPMGWHWCDYSVDDGTRTQSLLQVVSISTNKGGWCLLLHLEARARPAVNDLEVALLLTSFT